jgi:hypothetical protein
MEMQVVPSANNPEVELKREKNSVRSLQIQKSILRKQNRQMLFLQLMLQRCQSFEFFLKAKGF